VRSTCGSKGVRKLNKEGVGLQHHRADQLLQMTLKMKRAMPTSWEQRELRPGWCVGGSGVVGREAAAGDLVIARLVLSLATSLAGAFYGSTPAASPQRFYKGSVMLEKLQDSSCR
jgi:hypothetical protein